MTKREGVPACEPAGESWWCRLKERIDYLWDRASACILTVNHRTPDGDGDFSISGGDGITVTDEDNGVRIAATITDETVEGIVGQEAAAREAGDAALGERITGEATARQQADQTLQADIDTRATQTALDAEETARQQADNALQADVDSRIPRSLPSSIVQDVTVAQTPTTVTLTLDRVDPDTGAGADQVRSLPVASASQAGVMSSAQVTQLQQASGDIEMLKGQPARYTVHLDTETPTQEQLQAAYDAITPAPPSPPKDGTTLLDLTYDKEYTWFATSSQWVDRGQTVVSLATQASPGIVQGADADGKVYVEGDGTMSVKGWDAVKDDIANAESVLNGKQNTITGGATTILTVNLTANRALISSSAGKVAVSAVTATELAYLDGVTSGIQAQLNGKVPTSRTINGKALTANITLDKDDVGLGNVDNTSDANKPISMATQQALDAKADTADLSGKVDKNQGTANAGKALVVGSDGMVTPGDVGGGGGSSITTFQFNGPNTNFDNFKEWVTSTAPYKQFSGRFNGREGSGLHDVSLTLTLGGSGLVLFGGGLYSRSSPDGAMGDYPVSQCRFEVVDNTNIKLTVFYADQDGASTSVDLFVTRRFSSFFGSAFVIN